MSNNVARVIETPGNQDALAGKVIWSPAKSIWASTIYVVAIIGGTYTASLEAFLVFLSLSTITLLGGHSLGMHRRLIHGSYQCPLWLEYFLVYLGVLVGLAGPYGMIYTHDMRDWAQRQKSCHDYFGHRQPFLIDWYWQLHCDIQLRHGPGFHLEERVTNDKFYKFIERTWMLQQLPLAIILYLIGDLSWVIWGVFVRVAVSITGHWLVGYFAHNQGQRYWHIKNASVQGYNVNHLGLITMGECWHNNHHSFPGSAKLGLFPNQTDPGWWVLCALKKLGLVWDLILPKDLPSRPELVEITSTHHQNKFNISTFNKYSHHG